MAEPTDDQLREYAAKLPQIYKDLLAAFPKVDPDRRSGDPVAIFKLEEQLESDDRDVRLEDVQSAFKKLVLQRFIRSIGGTTYCAPTPIGERLISVITNHVPRPATIPELPQPSWAS